MVWRGGAGRLDIIFCVSDALRAFCLPNAANLRNVIVCLFSSLDKKAHYFD
jgi:hypothetical protein